MDAANQLLLNKSIQLLVITESNLYEFILSWEIFPVI